jgi:hypothetical protein
LLSGLKTSSLLSRTGPNTFAYKAKQGETFNITVSTKDDLNLGFTLRDVQANFNIASQAANITAPGFMKYTAKSSMDIEVVVTERNTSPDGVFSIELQSDISGGDNCQPVTNATQPANATDTRPTPTPTSPQPFIGNACTLEGSWSLLVVHIMLLFFAAL